MIIAEPITITEIIPDELTTEIFFVPAGGDAAITLMTNGFVRWYDDPEGSILDIVGRDTLSLTNFTGNQTFYAENILFLQNGESCRSEIVPFVVTTNTSITSLGYLDNDGDSFGDSASPVAFGSPMPDGIVLNADDCDDNRANVFPGAPETCDDVDNDCDGIIDEDLPTTIYYADNDEDGYGDIETVRETCLELISRFVTNSDDCDDTNPNINPDAIEIEGNDIDENCNGSLTSTHNLSGLRINVYPSPASDFIYVEYNSQSPVEMKIYDLQGRLHLTAHNSQRLDVSKLAEGTYLLTLRNEETGDQVTDRVVVVR